MNHAKTQTGKDARLALAAGLALLLLAALACNAPGIEGTTVADFPSVTISAPPTGSRVLLGQELSIESTSTHPNGITHVELWVDGARYRSDSPPASDQRLFEVAQPWSASLVGMHTLEVRVFSSAPTAAAAAQIIVEVVDNPALLTATPPGGSAQPPVGTPGASATPGPSPSPTPTATATATGTPTPVGGMVFVLAGAFTMGSDAGERDERPVHVVTLDGFNIDRTEVTLSQFKAFVGATGYRTIAEQRGDANNWRQFDAPDRLNQPVRWMTWDDASAYCAWAGKRLPTEAEWEKAARGIDARAFPWGNTFVSALVPHGDAADAGSIAGNAGPFGTLDQAGNVWEWIADWYDANYYSVSPAANPRGPDSGVARVLRGGGYNNGENDLRTANRHSGGEQGYAPDHGFRCAK
jgi:formylglycine-generating enzyme required for sulfatase activity